MTYSFDAFPCGGQVIFVRANLDLVSQMMEDYPRDWNGYPGSQTFDTKSIYQLIHKGRTCPSDWIDLLLPQNYDARSLFIDVDHPDWIAIINGSYDKFNLGYGPYWYRYHDLGIRESTGLLGIEEIRIKYDVRLPHPEYDHFFNGSSLHLTVNSTLFNESELIKQGSYIRGEVWTNYQISTYGYCGFEGIDVPIIGALTENEKKEFPIEIPGWIGSNVEYLSNGSQWHPLFNSEDEIVEAFHPYLPFDVRGCKRVPECISLARIDSWLNETFGIRWNDPSFYDGDSLLYHLSEPGGFKDFFKPRIPVEKFYDMRGIDHDYIRDLVARGKL